jgi:heptose I phosphotransferase
MAINWFQKKNMIKIFKYHNLFKKISFNDIYALKGKVYRKFSSRETLQFSLENESFFIKRFYGETLVSFIKNLFSFKKEFNNAYREYNAYKIFSKLGIKTPELVAFGSENSFFNQRSFVISRELKNIQQLDVFFVNSKYKTLALKYKAKILKKIVEIINKMHMNKVIHYDLYLCHFLVDINKLKKGTIKIYIIDFHRVEQMQRYSMSRLVKEIGAFFFSMQQIRISFDDCYKLFQGKYEPAIGDSSFYNKVLKRTIYLHKKYDRKFT